MQAVGTETWGGGQGRPALAGPRSQTCRDDGAVSTSLREESGGEPHLLLLF